MARVMIGSVYIDTEDTYACLVEVRLSKLTFRLSLLDLGYVDVHTRGDPSTSIHEYIKMACARSTAFVHRLHLSSRPLFMCRRSARRREGTHALEHSTVILSKA